MIMITCEMVAAEVETRFPTIDDARLQRALKIARNRTMIYNAKCPPGQYDVRSENGNNWYRVDLKKHTCTCEDNKRGNVCKHRLAAYIYSEQIARSIAAALEDGRKAAAVKQAQVQAPKASETRMKHLLRELGLG